MNMSTIAKSFPYGFKYSYHLIFQITKTLSRKPQGASHLIRMRLGNFINFNHD